MFNVIHFSGKQYSNVSVYLYKTRLLGNLVHINMFGIGDCEQAICGGVSAIMYPDMFISLSKAR